MPSTLTNDKTQELYDRKTEIYGIMQDMLKRSEDSEDGWSDEEEGRWKELNTEFDLVDGTITREQGRIERNLRLESLEATVDKARHVAKKIDGNDGAEAIEDDLRGTSFQRAVTGFFRGKNATQKEVKAMSLYGFNGKNEIELQMPASINRDGFGTHQFPDGTITRNSVKEYFAKRQQGVGVDADGGYTVPEGMMQPIDIALLHYAGQRAFATTLRTSTGRAVPHPTVNDTAVQGEIIAENAAANTADITFGQVVTTPFLYSSKYVPVSIQLMQDSNENMDALVGRLLGERIGRIQGQHFADGAGSTLPFGVMTSAAASGVTLTTINAPTHAELLDIKYSVDRTYRGPGSGWIIPDVILGNIRALKHDMGAWQPGLAAGAANTIDGDPYHVINEVDTAASGRSMAYGQLDKYLIHDATSVVVRRLDEIHALNHQVTFLGFMRSDAALIDAGTDPIKYALNP